MRDGGALAVSLVPRLFPHRDTTSDPSDHRAVVLSNLCVSNDHRRRGVGRLLVRAILALGAPRTYLLVARTGEGNANAEIAEAFADRVARLRATYHHLGFETVDDRSKDALLLCHVPSPPSPDDGHVHRVDEHRDDPHVDARVHG